MDCEKYFELMSAALDGELSAEERRRLDSHLAVCPQCAQLFDLLRANAEAARRLDCEMPADLKARIMGSLPQQEKPAKQGRVIHWKRWAPAAAAACLVLVAALLPFGSRGAGNNAAYEADGVPNSAPRADYADPASSVSVEAADGSVSRDGGTADDAGTSYGINTGDPPTETEDISIMTGEDLDPGLVPGQHENTGGVTGGSEQFTGEPEACGFENPQTIRVSYGFTPAPGAVVIGSAEELADYLARFGTAFFDGNGDPIPHPELAALAETYTGDFFRTHRLLCVVVESGSGSSRYELRGLTRSTVTILERIPEIGTCDMAAWLLTAEVDTMFEGGDVPDVVIIN